MVIFLFGPDTFRSREKLRRVVVQYQDKVPEAWGLARFAGGELTGVDIGVALRGNSLFQRKRLVVFERPDESPAEIQAQLMALLGSRELIESTDTVAVVWFSGSLQKGSDFARLAARKGIRVESFELLGGAPLKRWIGAYARELGATIEAGAVAALVAACGADTWRLALELEKLVSYAAGKAVSTAHVAALVVQPASPHAFALADAVAKRDRSRALELLHEHLEAGDSPQALVGMMAYALRTLVLVRAASVEPAVHKSGPPTAMLVKTLDLHPFVVAKALRHIEQFTQPELRRAIQFLADTDWRMKTGRLDPALALERFVVAVTK
ncbi:DNA polymerase III subunit delta [Candidatus Parcubacteria bacterium]|nr:DNA polymerase III subunit delta [Candidatus Parcubacteria bacterium]